MFRILFRECPFLLIALIIFILVGSVGVIKEKMFIGIGIGLATALIFVVIFVSIVCFLFGGLFWVEYGHRWFSRWIRL